MKNKFFDNIIFTRINIKKISAKKIIKKYLKIKDQIILIWLDKDDQYLTEYDEWYYDKNNILKEYFKDRIFYITYKDLNMIFDLETKNNIKYFIVGYYKSIAWIYRYLKNTKIKKIRIVE